MWIIGVPHPYKVQVPIAYITLNDKYENDVETINSIEKYCEENLAKYMLPKKFIVIKEFPKTMIGKIDYKELGYTKTSELCEHTKLAIEKLYRK